MHPGKIRQIKSYLIPAIIISVLIITYILYDISHCDLTEQAKIIQTPNGKKMPLYSELKSSKSFGELSKKCEYEGDKINCPDIRHFGVSMNHQSLLALARMLAILDLICRKYDIKYFIDSATLLGAKRNGRMLPWDYDGDIGIMIDDYRKLLVHIRKDLPDDLYFQDGSDNPWYKKASDSKIRDRNSCYTYCVRTGCKWEDGLQLDIFVFRKKVTPSTSIIKTYYHPLIYNVYDVFPIKDIELEGVTLQGPNNIDGVLKSNYGPDFKKPPPKLKGQCSKSGFLSIPWYSCNYIKNLPNDRKMEVLRMSEDRKRKWFDFIF